MPPEKMHDMLQVEMVCAQLVAIIPLQIAPAEIDSRLCEAFVRSRSAVKPHVGYNFGITCFGPQPHARQFLPRDDKCHVAKSMRTSRVRTATKRAQKSGPSRSQGALERDAFPRVQPDHELVHGRPCEEWN